MTVTTPRISADEFLSGDYPTGSELVDGVVHITDATFRHQRICGRIHVALVLWIAGGGTGETGWGGNWVLSERHVYQPDVWWCREAPTGKRHEGPPDLAVEVRSPGTWYRDIGVKRRRYTRSGVGELWLVDTPARSVLAVGPGDEREIGPGERLTSPLLPGFGVAVDELFAGGDT